ncbi:PIG-L family deacetylase [Streptosporangium soli]|nr:PIG-L family deacetylase [Streptosporangium sp. KLBMP 9127]
MDDTLTLMAVHAHPDDEVIGTGGLFAKCAEEGIRTVLVTCTNGEQGDGPGGVKPGEPGHDEAAVREQRLAELRDSAAHLGIDHVELLGYHDSGMVGWAGNEAAAAFANVEVDQAAARLVALIERYRPQVIVTYDENGGYGHPDHIQAHRITVAAVERSDIPRKLYHAVVPRERVSELFALMRAAGEAPADLELPPDFGTPEALITSVVDVSPYVEQKRKALEAHASQGENIFLLRLPAEAQRQVFGQEAFVRTVSRVPAADREDDLFDGLR